MCVVSVRQVTLWDMSVEEDVDEARAMGVEAADLGDIPPQLLFVHQVCAAAAAAHCRDALGAIVCMRHRDVRLARVCVEQGQRDVKEVHCHRQVKGMIISTASDGFNFFIPNIQLAASE
jgi:ribosome assembly protein RRB1